MVKTQVESQVRTLRLPSRHVRRLTLRTLAPQIKVRDLSNMSVTASPADYNSWEAVRNELMSEAKKGLKARVEAEVAAAKEDDDLDAMKLAFQGEERDLEHSIDHEVHTFSCVLDVRVDPSNRVLTPLLTSLLITDVPIRRSITISCRSKRATTVLRGLDAYTRSRACLRVFRVMRCFQKNS